MKDPRIATLAKNLINYSVRLQKEKSINRKLWTSARACDSTCR